MKKRNVMRIAAAAMAMVLTVSSFNMPSVVRAENAVSQTQMTLSVFSYGRTPLSVCFMHQAVSSPTSTTKVCSKYLLIPNATSTFSPPG